MKKLPLRITKSRSFLALVFLLLLILLSLLSSEPATDLPLHFNFCRPLSHSKFTLQPRNLKKTVESIDARAAQIYAEAMDEEPELNKESMLRLVCYTALTEMKSTAKLQELSTEHFFPYLSFKRESDPVTSLADSFAIRNCTLKQKYNLTYFFMVHDAFPNLQNLYELLYDDDVFFYFHIDVKRPHIHQLISTWLATDPIISKRCNHAIMPNPFNVLWGHSSMIMAQIESFFQLYHFIDWDYIINLSVDHYPIKSTKSIYRILQKTPGYSVFGLTGK